MKDLNLKSSYDYELPEELIAQYPLEKRDESRLLIVDRKKGNFESHTFSDLESFLGPKDHLVVNNTKVLPARLIGHKKTGRKIEVLLHRRIEGRCWEALTRPAKKLKVGDQILFDGAYAEVLSDRGEGLKLIEFNLPETELYPFLETCGGVPLPPYIRKGISETSDKKNYQTQFAKKEGAVAAPTAGLHFTEKLLKKLSQKGVGLTEVTLHVGLGTFMPVSTDHIKDHKMHFEQGEISSEASETLKEVKKKQKRLISVGTTVCRTLESAMQEGGRGLTPGTFETNLFITPGFEFKGIDSLITNFHLPGSTLLMLVSAFAGYDLMIEAYKYAVHEKYRFFSYGDAMWII